jgi:hypothetical protein
MSRSQSRFRDFHYGAAGYSKRIIQPSKRVGAFFKQLNGTGSIGREAGQREVISTCPK